MNRKNSRSFRLLSHLIPLGFLALLALAFAPGCGTDMISMAERGRDALCKENCKRLLQRCEQDCDDTAEKVTAIKASGAALPPDLRNWTAAACRADCDSKHGQSCVDECEAQYSPDALPE